MIPWCSVITCRLHLLNYHVWLAKWQCCHDPKLNIKHPSQAHRWKLHNTTTSETWSKPSPSTHICNESVCSLAGRKKKTRLVFAWYHGNLAASVMVEKSALQFSLFLLHGQIFIFRIVNQLSKHIRQVQVHNWVGKLKFFNRSHFPLLNLFRLWNKIISYFYCHPDSVEMNGNSI